MMATRLLALCLISFPPMGLWNAAHPASSTADHAIRCALLSTPELDALAARALPAAGTWPGSLQDDPPFESDPTVGILVSIAAFVGAAFAAGYAL